MVRIHGRANSINVQKVMWCAGEIGLEVERIDMGLKFGGNDTPEYLAKNPNGLIPTIEDGDFVAWESHTIVRYTAEKYGSGSWNPESIETRAHASQWMDWFISRVHPLMTTIFWNVVRLPPEKRDTAAADKAIAEIGGVWRILDTHLNGKKFILGDDPSIGDIPLGCAAYRYLGMDIDRPSLPHLTAWYERLTERPPYRENVMLPIS